MLSIASLLLTVILFSTFLSHSLLCHLISFLSIPSLPLPLSLTLLPLSLLISSSCLSYCSVSFLSIVLLPLLSGYGFSPFSVCHMQVWRVQRGCSDSWSIDLLHKWELHILPIHFNYSFTVIFILFWVFVHLWDCGISVCLPPTKMRKSHQIPWNWSYGWW